MMNIIEKMQEDFNEIKTYDQARTACIGYEKEIVESFKTRNNQNVGIPQLTPEEISESGLKAIKDFEKSRRPEAMKEPQEHYDSFVQEPNEQGNSYAQKLEELNNFER